MGKPTTKIAWVVYSLGSGAVYAVYFREPTVVKPGYGVVKAALNEQEIQRPHHLKVVGGKVITVLGMGGI